jgi:hypothetical protein
MATQLMPHAFTTLNTRARKSKNAAANLQMAWIEECKYLRKMRLPLKSFDDYVLYRQGKYKPKLRGVAPTIAQKRQCAQYPSLEDNRALSNSTYARQENKYTGTLIKGICGTHKSNDMPIINKEQAKDAAAMRR